MQKKPILILGVGNYILRDEGVGIHIAKQLLNIKLPSNIEVIDGGTSGYDLLPFIEGRERIIVIDAIHAGDQPGSIYKFTPQDVNNLPKNKISLHQIELLDVLNLVDLTTKLPETIIFGVEPKEVYFSMDLSPEIEKVIPTVINLVLKELS